MVMSRSAILLLFTAAAAFAQPQPARPAFEAASIKPNNSVTGHSQTHGSKGQVLMSNQSLKRLIERAYDVQSFQVSGPGWLEDVRFDIAAKFPPDSKAEDRLVMLRTLLEDRFKLETHHETREMPGYSLVVAKGGFKLKPVDAAGGSDTNGTGARVQTLTAKRTTIAYLANLLSRYTGQMVVDNTGIEGAYDFEFRWTPGDQADSADGGETAPSLFTALEETLGLHLRAQKIPVEIVVVDRVERTPVEN
jgi:uncharacterized protein (TIGR03435 family)